MVPAQVAAGVKAYHDAAVAVQRESRSSNLLAGVGALGLVTALVGLSRKNTALTVIGAVATVPGLWVIWKTIK